MHKNDITFSSSSQSRLVLSAIQKTVTKACSDHWYHCDQSACSEFFFSARVHPKACEKSTASRALDFFLPTTTTSIYITKAPSRCLCAELKSQGYILARGVVGKYLSLLCRWKGRSLDPPRACGKAGSNTVDNLILRATRHHHGALLSACTSRCGDWLKETLCESSAKLRR